VGLEAFRCLMNDDRMNGIPLVLETPEVLFAYRTWC
jgi:endonuclease IV